MIEVCVSIMALCVGAFAILAGIALWKIMKE